MSAATFVLSAQIVGLLAYLAFSAFCLFGLVRTITGKALLVASVITLGYLTSLLLTGDSLLTIGIGLPMQAAWLVLVLRAMGVHLASFREATLRPLWLVLTGALGAVLFGLVNAFWLIPQAAVSGEASLSPLYTAELLLAVCGLVATEQLARNTREDLRWRLRFLTIGVGTIFTLALAKAAFALLYGQRLGPVVMVEPLVLALVTPLLTIASLRNRDERLRVNVSRAFVFRTGVLVAAGVALLLFGMAGYYAQLFGGNVATALVALLGTVSAIIMIVMLGSTRVQAHLRRTLARTLFSGRHDYRALWERISGQLTEPSADFSHAQQGVRSLLTILDCSSGALWYRSASGTLVPEAQMHAPWRSALPPALSHRLREFFEAREWTIDLADPPPEFPAAWSEELQACCPTMRFVVPLCVQGELFGIVGTGAPRLETRLDWEDYDVLRLAARQTAGFLALEQAAQLLNETERLNTYNRLSAFVVHDLKTIAAQLGLLIENADRHKRNPAFVDDMIATTANALGRMERLLKQFREQGDGPIDAIELSSLLRTTLENFANHTPKPDLSAPLGPVSVRADPARLSSVINHTVENAIEATDPQGSVTVRLAEDNAWAEITVEDSGAGMTPEFVEQELFKPFHSTKGVMGMGIGAYQAREYLRSLGGDVDVVSATGRGTRFTMRIPRSAA